MVIATDNASADTATLKAQLNAASAEISALQRKLKSTEVQLRTAIEALRIERCRAYGARSEKSPGQAELFDEAESTDAEDDITEGDTELPSAAAPNKRPRPVRKPLPAELPRIRRVHELDAADRQCPCGCTMREIGETTSEELDIVPATIQVIEHVRKTYSCSKCDESIRTAPPAPSMLPKSIVSSNSLAYLVTAKFADGLPLYRMSTILKRYGIDLPRQTLSESVLKGAGRLEPLIEVLRGHLQRTTVMHMDETRVQVLKEPGKSARSQSYMWVQRGGPPGQTTILFTYDPSRSAAVPERLLAGYDGALMSDGYEAYRRVSRVRGLDHLCCWAHARRKFVDAKKAQPKGKSGKADAAIALIGKLYAVERECATSDAVARHRTRQARSVPVLAQLHAWLLKTAGEVPPKSAIGKAVHYALDYWVELSRYVENGDWPIDNNVAENAIRPFVVGRKAWLFSNSQRGAKASANLYSLIETAKANGQEPYRYLCWLFKQFPVTAPEDIAQLAPWSMPTEA